MAQQSEKIDALIFIDTNILLDFYRIRKSDISMKYLKEIEKHKDKLILTSQVDMEFRKNRQAAILESIHELNKASVRLSMPTILLDAYPVSKIQKSQKEIESQQKKIRARIERIFENPNKYDIVYKTLLKLFKTSNDFNLNRENEKRFALRKLALKRFYLGYPPRKERDNSIGDAINWEWIVSCAQRSGKHIIIVTRDSDYGATYNNKSHLNDWLKVEFRERVNSRRKIILTDKLSVAFKYVDIPVTEEMIEEENSIISKEAKSSDDSVTNPMIVKWRDVLMEIISKGSRKVEE